MEGAATAFGEATLVGRAVRTPRTSVVIPTYNRAASLRRVLHALQQARVPAGGMEIIVVDDGSSDDTVAVAAAAGVECLSQQNYGPAAARERGWRAAHGDCIVFMDDDVVPEPDAVANLVGGLDTADGVGATILPLDGSSLVSHYMHVDSLVNHRVTDGGVRWLITAAAAFRRSALEEVGGFDLTFPRAAGEDVDLAVRLLEAGYTLQIHDDAVVFHDHRTNFRGLVSTCFRYGTASPRLAARHDTLRADRTRSALLRFNPAEWVRLYRAYRCEASRARALAFLVLHAIVALPYACGMLRGDGIETPPHVLRVGVPTRRVPAERPELVPVTEGAPAA